MKVNNDTSKEFALRFIGGKRLTPVGRGRGKRTYDYHDIRISKPSSKTKNTGYHFYFRNDVAKKIFGDVEEKRMMLEFSKDEKLLIIEPATGGEHGWKLRYHNSSDLEKVKDTTKMTSQVNTADKEKCALLDKFVGSYELNYNEPTGLYYVDLDEKIGG